MAAQINYSALCKYLYYVSGLGMKIYKSFHYGIGVEAYTILLMYLLHKDQQLAQRDVMRPIYWDQEQTEGQYCIPLLVHGNIVVDIYQKDRLFQEQRDLLIARMRLTHIPYGMVCNFDRSQFYSEWYVRDADTGLVDRLNMMK